MPRTAVSPVINVAVWDLENLSPGGNSQDDLGEILAGRVIETIRNVPRLTVVERQRLRLALEELHLGSSVLAGETDRLRIGSLVGASRMIFGGYMMVGKQVRIDLRMIDVESGATIKAVSRATESAHLDNLFRAVESAAAALF